MTVHKNGKQYHYRADHWTKQKADVFANMTRYQERVNRGEICSRERAEEVLSSARGYFFKAHVYEAKMQSDPLRINGISFGVMLDDAKKEIGARIQERAKEYQRVADLQAGVTDLYFRSRSTQLNVRRFLGIDHGAGRDHAVAGRYYVREGGRRFGKTVGLASIGEKGRELYGSWPAYPVDTKVKTNGLELDHIVEDDDERFALYDAVAAIRKRNGYYDPWYLKAWKKITAWIRVK